MSEKCFKIYFGIENHLEERKEKVKKEILENNVESKFNFSFYYYNSSTIRNLKEYFLTTFGKSYNFCQCLLYLYSKTSRYFSENVYQLLSQTNQTQLKDYSNYNDLYLIKVDSVCQCEFKGYSNYMNMSKFDLINIIKGLEKSDEIQNYNKLQFEDFYDIVININSIKNVNKLGWKVKFNEKGLNKYKEHIDQKNLMSITLGVIGNSNKGKSFILSKISEINLLSGTSIQTEGLSVKYPDLSGHEKRQLILLDSAGLETPVLKANNKEKEKEYKNEIKNDNNNLIDNNIQNNEIINENLIIDEQEKNNEIREKINEKKNGQKKEEIKPNNKEIVKNEEFKENARDKIMTEIFLQNFIIQESDILLVVVGKLTYSEQLLINKIKEESKRQKREKILIIHNLQEFRTIKQVEDYIKDTLEKCSTFNLIKRKEITISGSEEGKNKKKNNEKLNDLFFTEIEGYSNKQLVLYHLILAYEDSEAGKFYNKFTYDYIKHFYSIIPSSRNFDVFERVKEDFKLLSKTILKDSIKDAKFTDNDKILKDKIIKLEYDKELILKKCFIDELGFSFFKTGNFEPKYNYFLADETTLEVRLEAPGLSTCKVSHSIVGDETIITIKGEKNKDKKPKNFDENLLNIREFSEYEINIPIKAEKFKINQEEPKKKTFINGIFCIQYELAPKSKETQEFGIGKVEDL